MPYHTASSKKLSQAMKAAVFAAGYVAISMLASCSTYPLGGRSSETFLGPEKRTGWFLFPPDGKNEAYFGEQRNPMPLRTYTPPEARREKSFF